MSSSTCYSEHVQLEQVVQGLVQSNTEYLRGGRLNKLFGQAMPAFDHFLVKKVFPFYNWTIVNSGKQNEKTLSVLQNVCIAISFLSKS